MSDKKKTLIEKIRQLFAEEMPPATPDPSAAPPATASITNTLADGRIITIDKMEAGGTAMIDSQPAAPGDYTLEDGTVITVADGGKISLVTPPAAPAAPVAPIDMSTPEGKQAAFESIQKFAVAPEMAVVLKALMEYCFGWEMRQAQEKATRDQAIEAYRTGFNKQVKDAEDKVLKLETTLKQMFELVEELAAIPQADPPGQPKSSTNDAGQSREDRFQHVGAAFRSLREK